VKYVIDDLEGANAMLRQLVQEGRLPKGEYKVTYKINNEKPSLQFIFEESNKQ
jgi:hypothetical protein